MAYFKILRMKTEGLMKKYKVANKLDRIFNSENIKIFAYLFLITRFYKIYQLVNYINQHFYLSTLKRQF
jgi:hypothetical protein